MDLNSTENRRSNTESFTLQNSQVLEEILSNGATKTTDNFTISHESTEGGVLHSVKAEIMDTHESEVFAEVDSRVQVSSKDNYKDYDTSFHGKNSGKEGYELSDINVPLQFPSFSTTLQEEDTQSTAEECNAEECNELQNENLLDKEMTADNVNSLHDKLRGTEEQNIPEYQRNGEKVDHDENIERNVVEEKKADEIPETEPAVQQISGLRENKMLLKSFPEHLEVQNLELTCARKDAEEEAAIIEYEISGTQPSKEPAPVNEQIVKEKPEDGNLEHNQQNIEMTGDANHVEEQMERETSDGNVKDVEEKISIGEEDSQFDKLVGKTFDPCQVIEDESSEENQIPYQSLFSASVSGAPADERLRTDGMANDHSTDNSDLISGDHISETLVANQIDEGLKKHVAENFENINANRDAKPTISGDESYEKNLVENTELIQDRNFQAVDRSDSVESKSTENQNYSANRLPTTGVETTLEKKDNLQSRSDLAFKEQCIEDDGREGMENEIGQENINGTIEEQKDQEGKLEESSNREEIITETLQSNMGQEKAKKEEELSYTSVTELTVLQLSIEKMVQKDEESLGNVEKTLAMIPDKTQTTTTTEVETQEETSFSEGDAHWRKPHDVSEKMDVEKATEEIDVGENEHMEIYEDQHEMVPVKEISAGKTIEEHKVSHSGNEIVDDEPKNKETSFTNNNSSPSVHLTEKIHGVHEQNVSVKHDKLSVVLHKEEECREKEEYQVEKEKQIAKGGMQDISETEAQEEINKSKAENEMSSDKIESVSEDMHVEAIADMRPFFDENAKNDDGSLSFLQYREQEKLIETSEVKTQEHANGIIQKTDPSQSIDKVKKDEPLSLMPAVSIKPEDADGDASLEKEKKAEEELVMDMEESSLAYEKKPEIGKLAAYVVHEYQVESCKILSQSMEIKDLYPKDEENVSKSIQSSAFIPVQADETREAQEEFKKTLHEEQIYENVIEENNITFDVTEEEFKTMKLERYSSIQGEKSSKEITGKEGSEKDIAEDTLSVSQDSVADRISEKASLMEDDKHNHDEREVYKSIGETVLEEAKIRVDSNSDKPQVEKGDKINILEGLDSKENLVSFQPQKNQEDMSMNEELLNGHGIPSNIEYEESAEVVGVESPGSIDEEVKYCNLGSQENFETTCDMEVPKLDDERNYNQTYDILHAKEASIEKKVETDTSRIAFEVLLTELEERDIEKLNKISELVTEAKLESFSPQNNQKELQREENTLNTCHNIPANLVYKESTLIVGVESPLEQIVDEEETFRITDKEVKNSDLVSQQNFQTYTEKWTNEVSDEWVCNPTNHALFAKEASTYEDTEKHTSMIVSDNYFHDAVEDKKISEKSIPGKDKGFQDADISSETVEEGKKQDERSEIQPRHIAPETISVNSSDKKERAEVKNNSKGVALNDKVDNMEPEYTLNVVSEEIQTVAANIDKKSLEIDGLKSELGKNIHRDAEKMLEKEMAELNTVNNSDEAHFCCEEGAEKQKEILESVNASEHTEGADATNENTNNIVHNELIDDIAVIESAGDKLQTGGTSEERFESTVTRDEEKPENNGVLNVDIHKDAKNIHLENPLSTVQHNIELEEPSSTVWHNNETDNSSKITEGLIAVVNIIEAPVAHIRYEMEHEALQKDEETKKEKESETKCEPGTKHAANASPNNEASIMVNDVECFPSKQSFMMTLDYLETGPSIGDEDMKKNRDAIVMATSENEITEVSLKLDEVFEKETEHEELQKDEAETEKEKEPDTDCDQGTNHAANASSNNENSMMALDNIESGPSIDVEDRKKNLDVIVMATSEKEITELDQKLDELSEKEMEHNEFQEDEIKTEKEKEQETSCEPGTSHVANASVNNEANDVKSFPSEQSSMMALDNIETGPLIDDEDMKKNSDAIAMEITEKEITEVGQKFDEVSEKDIEHEELQKDEAATEKKKEPDTQCYPGTNHAANASSNNEVNEVKCFASEDSVMALDNIETGPSIYDEDTKNFDAIVIVTSEKQITEVVQKNDEVSVITTSEKQITEAVQKLAEVSEKEMEHEEFQKDEVETEKENKLETYCEHYISHAANASKNNESSMMALDNIESGESIDDEDSKKNLDTIVIATSENEITEVDQKLDEVSEKEMDLEELLKDEDGTTREEEQDTKCNPGANHAANASPNNENSVMALDNIETAPPKDDEDTKKNLDAIVTATPGKEIKELGQKLNAVSEKEMEHADFQEDEVNTKKEKEQEMSCEPGTSHIANTSLNNQSSMMGLDNIKTGPLIDDEDTEKNIDAIVMTTSENEITQVGQKLDEASQKEIEHEELQKPEAETEKEKEPDTEWHRGTNHAANASPNNENSMMTLDNIETGLSGDNEDTKKIFDVIFVATSKKEITEVGQKLDEVSEKEVEHEEFQKDEVETQKEEKREMYFEPGTSLAANASANNEVNDVKCSPSEQSSMMALDNIKTGASINDEDMKKNLDAIVMATSENKITEVGQKLDGMSEKEIEHEELQKDEAETKKEKEPYTKRDAGTNHAAYAYQKNGVNDVKCFSSDQNSMVDLDNIESGPSIDDEDTEVKCFFSDQNSMMALDNVESGPSIDDEDTKKNPDVIVMATSEKEITEQGIKLDELSEKEMEHENFQEDEVKTEKEKEKETSCAPGTSHVTNASLNNESSTMALDNIETGPLIDDEDTKKNSDPIVMAITEKELTEVGQKFDEVSEKDIEHEEFEKDEAETEKEKEPDIQYYPGINHAMNASSNNEVNDVKRFASERDFMMALDNIETGPSIDDEDTKKNFDAIVIATSENQITEVGQKLGEVSEKEMEYKEFQKDEVETEKDNKPETYCEPYTSHAANASKNNESSMMALDNIETGESIDDEDTKKNLDTIVIATSENKITEVDQKLDEVSEKEMELEELLKHEDETKREKEQHTKHDPGTNHATNASPSNENSIMASEKTETALSEDDEDTKKNPDAIVMAASGKEITELGQNLDEVSEKEMEHGKFQADEIETEKEKKPEMNNEPGTSYAANVSPNNESSMMGLDNTKTGPLIDDEDTKKNLDVIVMATSEKEITELGQKLDEISEKEMEHEEFREYEVKIEKEKEQETSCEPGTSHVANPSLNNEVNDVESFPSEQSSMMALDNIEIGPLINDEDMKKNRDAVVMAITEKEIIEVGQKFDEVSEKDLEHEELRKDEAETEKEKEPDTRCYPGTNHAANASSNNEDSIMALDNIETGPSIDNEDKKKNFDAIVIATSKKQITEVGQMLGDVSKKEMEHEEFQKDEVETEKEKKPETYCETYTSHEANASKNNESSMMALDNLETGPSIDDEDMKKNIDAIFTETLEKEIIEVDQMLDEVSEKKMEHEELQNGAAEIEKENELETICEPGANHAAKASPNNEVNIVKCLPSEQGLNNIEPGPSMDVGNTKKNHDATIMATSEKETTEVGQKLDEVSDAVPREPSEEASTNNVIASEYQKEEKSDPEGHIQANKSEYNCTCSASAHEKSNVCPVTVEVNVKDKDVSEGTRNVLLTNESLGISTICQEGRENTGEPLIVVSKDEVEKDNISSIEAIEDVEKLNKSSSLQEIEVNLPTEEREICDAKPKKQENHGEHLNDTTIPKQQVLFLSTNSVTEETKIKESMAEAQREHDTVENHTHGIEEEDMEDAVPEDYVTPQSNLSYPSSSMVVDEYVKDENILEQEVISTSSQAEQVNETNYVESNAESPNKLMDTSDLVKAQKDLDSYQTMEKTVVKGDESPSSNDGDTYPIVPVAEDVKNEVSGLLCQVSTDVSTYDTKSMTSRDQSGPHNEEEIEQSRDLHLEQDEKIHAADKNIESLSKDFDVSNVSRVQEVCTSLNEGSKDGNIVLQDHENIDKATFKEKTPLISESVGNTKSFLQSDETTEIPEYNQNEKTLEVSNTKALLDIKSEAEKNSEENHNGDSKSHVKNMDIDYVEESKTDQEDENSLQDKENELNLKDKKAKNATGTLLKDEKADEGKEEKEEKDGIPEEKQVTEITNTQPEEDKSDEEKEEKEERYIHKVEDNDAAIMEKGKDEESKSAHKKSHNILSGVGSKVKHSLSKVKKAIIGKSSHSKTASPKQ